MAFTPSMFMRGGSSGTGLQADLDARLAASGIGNGGAIAEGYARTPAQQAAAGLDNSNFGDPIRVTKADNTDFSNPTKALNVAPQRSGGDKASWIDIVNAFAMAKNGQDANAAAKAASNPMGQIGGPASSGISPNLSIPGGGAVGQHSTFRPSRNGY